MKIFKDVTKVIGYNTVTNYKNLFYNILIVILMLLMVICGIYNFVDYKNYKQSIILNMNNQKIHEYCNKNSKKIKPNTLLDISSFDTYFSVLSRSVIDISDNELILELQVHPSKVYPIYYNRQTNQIMLLTKNTSVLNGKNITKYTQNSVPMLLGYYNSFQLRHRDTILFRTYQLRYDSNLPKFYNPMFRIKYYNLWDKNIGETIILQKFDGNNKLLPQKTYTTLDPLRNLKGLTNI